MNNRELNLKYGSEINDYRNHRDFNSFINNNFTADQLTESAGNILDVGSQVLDIPLFYLGNSLLLKNLKHLMHQGNCYQRQRTQEFLGLRWLLQPQEG